MPPKSNLGICSRILRPMQKTKNICWFLADIVVMFYSQRSRRVIMEASKTWDKKDTVINLFRDLLYNRYLIVGSDPHNSEEHETFNENTFIEILQGLYAKDNIKFPYNPVLNLTYSVYPYLCKLYNLLGVDYKVFEILLIDDVLLYYSSLNKEYDGIDIPTIPIYKDNGHAPSILIIANHSLPDYMPFVKNEIKDDKVKVELASLKEKLTYNEVVYTLDSVIITNINEKPCYHTIVGLTCKQKKYVYNGQPYKGRNFPCQLINHNWNIREDIDFYLSYNDCELHDTPQPNSSDRLYNFSKGEITCIYVRKNASRDTSHSKESDVEKYRKEKELALIKEKDFTSNLKNIEAIMANLKDDRKLRISPPKKADTKRKSNSSSLSNGSPKLITRPTPKKAKTKTKRKRNVGN